MKIALTKPMQIASNNMKISRIIKVRKIKTRRKKEKRNKKQKKNRWIKTPETEKKNHQTYLQWVTVW